MFDCRNWLRGLGLSLALLAAIGGSQGPSLWANDDTTPPPPDGMVVAWQDQFEKQPMEHYQTTDPSSWTIRSRHENSFMALIKKQSDFSPRHRSPFNRALVKELEVGSFVMDVRVQSTIADYPHRDLCVFFGYQDDEHLYYAHLGKRTDDHANQIFIVNDAPRKKISTRTTPGTQWTDDWHHIRVVRELESGKIEIYFDDLSKPVMTAQDTTFGVGQVGFGSFDDTGNFDNLRVYVPKSR